MVEQTQINIGNKRTVIHHFLRYTINTHLLNILPVDIDRMRHGRLLKSCCAAWISACGVGVPSVRVRS
jgi:hypothetical protein